MNQLSSSDFMVICNHLQHMALIVTDACKNISYLIQLIKLIPWQFDENK